MAALGGRLPGSFTPAHPEEAVCEFLRVGILSVHQIAVEFSTSRSDAEGFHEILFYDPLLGLRYEIEGATAGVDFESVCF